jgi:hypothetical protein
VIGAVGAPAPNPAGYLGVFFTSSTASRQSGVEVVGRLTVRTEDRDRPTTWQARQAQYDAVCAWGIPDHGLLPRVSAIDMPVFVANGDSDPMILPHYFRRLRKSFAPISGFDRPSRARRAICSSCGVSTSRVSGLRLRTTAPATTSSRPARSANASMPMATNSSWAARSRSPGSGLYADRPSGLIAILWRAGPGISEAAALMIACGLSGGDIVASLGAVVDGGRS